MLVLVIVNESVVSCVVVLCFIAATFILRASVVLFCLLMFRHRGGSCGCVGTEMDPHVLS